MPMQPDPTRATGPIRLDAREAGFTDAFDALVADQREAEVDLTISVREILEKVRRGGDEALFTFTQTFDQTSVTADTVRLDPTEIAEAAAQVPAETVDALKLAARRIEAFHARQRFETDQFTDDVGVTLGARYTPIEAVGLYVPGGTAAYPSSLLMNAIPAKVAGVDRIVMVTPPGRLSPLMMAAAHIVDIDEIYRIGGAQAVGALAYGTESIPKVDKIVGPGNAFVSEAKRQVFGTVGIDMVAGPSEILVVADAENDPSWIAIDLLSQAEHDPVAQSILITDNAAFANAVAGAVEDWLDQLPRADIARASWNRYGAIITVPDLIADSPALVDRLAPEHLELAVAEPEALAARVRHAGSIFLGRMTPEAIGDYVGGANHVLPTARRARFSSGLSVADFMKRTTLLSCSKGGLASIGPAAVALAQAEGLDAHAQSVAVRLID